MEVGLVRVGNRDAELLSRIETVAEKVVSIPVEDVDEAAPDLWVVPTIDSLRTLVREEPDAPVVVVDGPDPLGPVGRHDLAATIETIRDGDGTERTHRALRVEANDTEAIAIEEAIAMTGEPASISEYAIRIDGSTVARYRADGVAIATAVGSGTYTRSAGGPILDPELAAVAVVPIAPYRTDPDHWVLDGAVEIEVLRDVGEVGLSVDGERRCDLSRGDRVIGELGPTYRICSMHDRPRGSD